MRHLFLFTILSLLILGGGSTSSRAASWWSAAFPPDQTRFVNDARQMLPLLALESDATFHEKTDAARLFVQNNSVHKIDQEFYSYWGNIPLLMQMIMFNATGALDDKPHMECSSRTSILYYLLKALNIKSRPVVVYTAEDVSDSHTFLEAYNPQTSKWEIQDPDKNLYWVFKDTNARASTEDLLRHEIKDTFVPCYDTGACAYNPKTADRLVSFFTLAALIDFEAGYNPLLINPNRFDIDHPFLKKQNPMAYCSLFKAGQCHSEIITLPPAGLQTQE